MEDDNYLALQKENEKLKKKVKKLESRLNSIIKMNDRTFKNIFNKNTSLEKDAYRFSRILQQSDKQAKSILIKNEQQEQMLYAKTKMAMMGEMIDNIAHQWKQPLNSISTIMSAITAKYKLNTLNDKNMERFAEESNKQIQYMSSTIDDFRDFLKETKTVKYFKLHTTIEKFKLLNHSLVLSERIALEVNIEQEDIELNGIENEFIQVLMNLLSNSVDALKDKSNEKAILIEVKKENQDLIISFKDNAGGIEEKNISKIFDYRFSTKKEVEGSGIGLHMSKKIIEKTFYGKMEVTNQNFNYKGNDYTGAEFIIKLPLS